MSPMNWYKSYIGIGTNHTLESVQIIHYMDFFVIFALANT